MTAPYELSAEAQSDLFEIWLRIATDSVELADRIENEFYELFISLARMPGQGHVRRDLTRRPVLMIPMYSFMVVYRADTTPIRIMAVLRGRRNLRKILKQRL